MIGINSLPTPASTCAHMSMNNMFIHVRHVFAERPASPRYENLAFYFLTEFLREYPVESNNSLPSHYISIETPIAIIEHFWTIDPPWSGRRRANWSYGTASSLDNYSPLGVFAQAVCRQDVLLVDPQDPWICKRVGHQENRKMTILTSLGSRSKSVAVLPGVCISELLRWTVSVGHRNILW